MVATMQFVFFFYIFIPITVSVEIFKLVNSSVQLDVQTKDYEFTDFTWSFNKSKNIVKYYKNSQSIAFTDYKNRVELNEKTQSLTLKNLQKTDSGLYEAVASGEQNRIVAEYQLTVLDPVEKPVLNGPKQQSNETCNVTLSCEAQKLSVTSHYYSDNCDMKKETTEDGVLSLSLYVSNSFIICNHSNPVSWKNITIEMEEVKKLCPFEGDKNHNGIIIGSVVFVIIIIIIIIIIISTFNWHKKHRTTGSGKAVYEEVKWVKKSLEMSENPEHPGTIYYTVMRPAQTCSNDESTVSTASPSNKKEQGERGDSGPEANRDDYAGSQNQRAGSIHDVPPKTVL
ncbi:uncharacterized protein LOC132871216 isoform X1 [Neoarius graeffei]|uniref:uncharacterized protein LOC132871216 isoform X1 n=1 Tax=Neoarius graeffei TaxID=443677 RepID=UPI00298C162D|nr:uncharacterized protein LOC132871216 isoform X1 [Neoarius graeffei]